MEKGQFVEVEIIDMTNEGNGVGKVDGFTVFVEGAVYGDVVRAGITNVKKNFAQAKATSFIKTSEFRADEDFVCPNIKSCGGCGYGKLKYETQLALKEKAVYDKLARLGGINDPKVNPIISMDEPFSYRNKATIAVYDDLVGFKEKKSNRVVDCTRCDIQSVPSVRAAETLRYFIKQNNLKGLFTSMVVRTTNLGEVMIILKRALNKKGRPVETKFDLEGLCYALDDAVFNNLESVYLDDKLVAGKPTILDVVSFDEDGSLDEESFNGLYFEVSPLSFYQVNPVQMVKLYNKALEYADIKPNDTVLDLYCGVGTIGIFAAKHLADKLGCSLSEVPLKIIGIESCAPAVIDANRNSVINGIVCTRYFTGKAEDELPFMMGLKKLKKPNEVNELVDREPEITIENVDVAIVDPPRAGCEKDLLDAVINSKASKLVYISCDPGTLARDVKYLTENGYTFVEATPVDMFPQTMHVESVVLLSRR